MTRNDDRPPRVVRHHARFIPVAAAALLLAMAVGGVAAPPAALAGAEDFGVAAHGSGTRDPVFAVSGTPIAREGTLTGNGVAPYSVAAGPGVVRASLSGSFTNPAGLTILYNPIASARADMRLTVSGPAQPEFITTSLNVHVDGVLSQVCGPTVLSCEATVAIAVFANGSSFFTDVSTVNGVSRNTLGLSVTPTADGLRVSGDVTTSPFGIAVNQPFSIRLSLQVAEADQGDGREATFRWNHDFGGGLSFAPAGPVLNVPDGYAVEGVGIVDNRWQDPFAPPDAVDDSVTVPAGSSGNAIDVLANDTVASGDLTITGWTNAAHGTATCSPTSCSYTPQSGFSGVDAFTYTVADAQGGTDTASVAITVTTLAPAARLTVGLDAEPDAPDDFVVQVRRSGVIDSLFLDADPGSDFPRAEEEIGPFSATTEVELELTSAPPHWQLDAIDCGGKGVFAPPDASVATFTLEPGDNVVCTVRVSLPQASLSVVLDAEPDTTENFTISGRLGETGLFLLMDGDPGTPEISEVTMGPFFGATDIELGLADAPPHWRLDAIDCGGKGVFAPPDASVATFMLEPGDNVVCTFAVSTTDVTPPSVTCPTPEPVFELGEQPADVSASVSDDGSGPEAETVTAAADTTTVGRGTVSLTGRDLAGNETTVECDYRVEYRFAGFSDPVQNAPTVNIVNAGRTAVLKWRLADASGAPITDLGRARLTAVTLACDLGTTPDRSVEQTAGSSGLQNLGDGWYQLNWRVPSSYAGSCKTLRLDLGEGAFRTALFRVR